MISFNVYVIYIYLYIIRIYIYIFADIKLECLERLYQVDPKERVDICFWGERDSRYIGFINSDGIFTENQ